MIQREHQRQENQREKGWVGERERENGCVVIKQVQESVPPSFPFPVILTLKKSHAFKKKRKNVPVSHRGIYLQGLPVRIKNFIY